MKIIVNSLHSEDDFELLDISTIKVNDIVVFDIYIKKDNNFVIIIEAGTSITEALYAKLQKQDFLYVEKKDKLLATKQNLRFLIRQNRENTYKSIHILYETTNYLFDTFFNNSDDAVDMECVKNIVNSIIFLVHHNEKFTNSVMPYFTRCYTFANHSLQVAVYAIKLGTLLKLDSEELLKLGIAALLHDVGFKKLSFQPICKNDLLNEDEQKEIELHPIYCVEILKKNHITDITILDAVKHHHERCDGSGYPNKLPKIHISQFASIVAICDVFDALTNDRPHRKKLKTFDALRMMLKDEEMCGKFNQQHLHLAIQSLRKDNL